MTFFNSIWPRIKSFRIKSFIELVIPIKAGEWKKFLPMGFMMFFILFNYSVLRSVKDTLLVGGVGAQAVSFAKTYAVMPAAVLFMIVYSRMTSTFSDKTIFYAFTGFFLGFFLLFNYALYPNIHIIHPDAARLALLESQKFNFGLFEVEGAHFKWFIKLYGNWSTVLFYVMSELWGSIMVSLLFWQFANRITQTTEAKRFYPMFGLLGNMSLIASGSLTGYLADKFPNDTATMLYAIMFSVILAIISVLVLYYFMNSVVLKGQTLSDTVASKKKEKQSLSFWEGFKVVFTSKYIGLIAVLVLSYGVSANLVEGPWKAKLQELTHGNDNAYLKWMGKLQTYTGITTVIIMYAGSYILPRISWFSGAILTPLTMLITGGGFFFLIVFNQYAAAVFDTLFGVVTPLYAAVLLGLWQNATSKGTKYAFFDATKEMAYIPADRELQTKGKAAVDVIGGRFGKSLGGIIQSTLFILMPTATFTDISPILMVIFLTLLVMWIIGAKLLSKEYEEKIAHQPHSHEAHKAPAR